MLLMQCNDNIPAVFGFPWVIPHQRRGGTDEEEDDDGGAHCSWQWPAFFFLNLFLLVVRCSSLHLLVPVRPSVNIRAQKGQVTEFTALFLSTFLSKGVHSWLAFYSMLLLMRFNLLGAFSSSSKRICQRHNLQTFGCKNWEFMEDNIFVQYKKRHTVKHTKQTRNKTSHLPVYLNTPICYDVGFNWS